MTTNEKTQIPHNFSKEVEYLYGTYEDAGVKLANGFQKDAIQNCVGARKANSWKNWNCNIYIKKTVKGLFLVVEDSGTLGLIGPNLSASDIVDMLDNNKYLDNNMRLARFSSMHNSGGNSTGAGTYGVGKIVYAAASKKHAYYFDSLTSENKYVANMLDCGNIHKKAFEEDSAIAFIKDKTGFEPKDTVGTRIIIVEPKDELIKAIKNGEFVKSIQETWWIILKRLDQKSSAIIVNGVKVPTIKHPKYKHQFNLSKPENYRDGYWVKHFGLHVNKEKNSEYQGFSYYRKGMKIGEVEINDVPDKLNDKYWGYIEVDETWESELAEIEDKIHFGVSKGKKNTNAYQFLKKYTNEMFRKLMIEWKYIKDKENADQKLKKEIEEIAEEIQELFETLNFEDLGTGPNNPDFDVRWQNIIYPRKGSEEVKLNEEISFDIRIKSKYLTKKTMECKLFILDWSNKSTISTISSDIINIESNSIYTKSFNLKINEENCKRYSENRIVLKVAVRGSGKVKTKELPFFFDIKKPNNSKEEVVLTLNSCTFPRENSRRINFDETLKDIAYRIENKQPHDFNFQLNVSIHDGREKRSSPKLVDIGSYTGMLKAYEESIINVSDICFAKNIYSNFLDKGQLQLRARLIALDSSEKYEKGDRITRYKYKLCLNCDEKSGKADAFQPQNKDAPNDNRRSWYETVGTDKYICINTSHIGYIFVEDYPEIQKAYIKEQMLKQYVFLYLDERKYNMFNDDEEKKLEDMDVIDANKAIYNQLEYVFTKSFK